MKLKRGRIFVPFFSLHGSFSTVATAVPATRTFGFVRKRVYITPATFFLHALPQPDTGNHHCKAEQQGTCPDNQCHHLLLPYFNRLIHRSIHEYATR